jgi:heterodisulfide reductase subunit C
LTGKSGTCSFIDEICAIPGGEDIRLCIQCGTCTASCPNADRMEHTPSELIAMARAGLRQEVLSSNAMWYCLSCYQCTARCPRGVNITELMHALERLAMDSGLKHEKTLTPAMYHSFNHFACVLGNLSEFGFAVWFYLLTNPFRHVKMLPIAFNMFRHGRLSVKSRRLSREGAAQLKAILDKAESLEGAL